MTRATLLLYIRYIQDQRLLEVVHLRKETTQIVRAEVQHEPTECELRMLTQQPETGQDRQVRARRIAAQEAQRHAEIPRRVLYEVRANVETVLIAGRIGMFGG